MRHHTAVGTALVLGFVVGVSSPAAGQICPPRDGVELPSAYARLLSEHPDAFAFRRSLTGKTARAQRARQAARIGKSVVFSSAVDGTVSIPVFVTRYSGGSDPYPAGSLQDRLFGPAAGLTLADYYSEISGGRLQVEGSVYGWTPLAHPAAYYQGSSNGLDPSDARTGELIQEALDAHDAAVDFGQYDNDGPDGIPNSGDDDGYVDFVAFVHPRSGGECGGNPHIWSHRWVYRAWPNSGGMPYLTNDASASGGPILIDDYTVQPGLSCDGSSPVEIGVFCHEFGHAFGLPDLYDTNGGGQGLGHWCLMANGNWNDPASPAHMSAWCKRELGWVTVEPVTWNDTAVVIPPVATDATVYEFSFRDERWRRGPDCALDGVQSLVLGLTAAESSSRGWMGSRGYGNRWHETVVRDLHYDGSGTVTFSYDYAVDVEPGYDFVFALLETGGIETTLAVYNGAVTAAAFHDLTPFLPGAGSYRLKFRFVSDDYASSEDGSFVSSCAAFVVDNAQVQGGGVDDFADFEAHVGGWFQPDDPAENPTSESWLVENRQRLGSDQNLHGEGLLIYHVDQEVVESYLGNSGGSSNQVTRGVVVEEADGFFDLLTSGQGRGDDGDVWPGAFGATSFDLGSTPDARTNSGAASRVRIDAITPVGDDISCTLQGGNEPPGLSSVQPSSGPAGGVVHLQLLGAQGIRPGATLRLVRAGAPDLTAHLVDWLDTFQVAAEVDLSGAVAGDYDVVVENPDGQTAWLGPGFQVQGGVTEVPTPSPVAPSLAQNAPNPFNPTTTIRYQIASPGPVSLTIYDPRGRHVKTLVAQRQPAGYHRARWHGDDDAGRPVASGVYVYQLRSAGERIARRMLLAK